MAVGEFAKSIYDLIEECGGVDYGSSVVLHDLIRFLPGQKLEEFVEHFRRNHSMLESNTLDEEQASEATNPPQGESKFVSSIIVEC